MSVLHISIHINSEKPEDMRLYNLLDEKKSKKKKFISDAVFEFEELENKYKQALIENQYLKSILANLNKANESNRKLLAAFKDVAENYQDVLTDALVIYNEKPQSPEKNNDKKFFSTLKTKEENEEITLDEPGLEDLLWVFNIS